MPTHRRRHAITETPRVEAALSALREELGEQRVEMAELVVLGAREKLEQVRREREDLAARRARLAARIRARSLSVDAEAAATVRREGWARP